MPESRGGSLLRRALRFVVFTAVVCSLVGVLTLFGLYQVYVVKNPGDHLQRAHIMQLISQESPVFYRDGETRLGVFFADEHRQYLPFDGIPQDFVDALVAAEDQDFWEHRGFSLSGITRAMVSNIKAGRVVAGGSTLTQQTAKNLFKRRGRTFKEKFRELANALRLEAVYDKEDILEFYSNQFYVNGNGRGLSIAARFFFDRDVSDLGLLECAFLAGVVKSPNRYNPWVAGAERQERASLAAHERAHYVLGRMLADGTINAQEHSQAIATEIPFQRGHFRFERSVVLDQIEKELSSPYFRALLDAQGIADFATSGLQVISSIDATMQRGASYGLRHHLTAAGTWLEAPKLEQLFRAGAPLRPVDPDRLVVGSFHNAILRSVNPADRTAELDLGGVTALVDAAGNKRLARMRLRAEKRNLWVDARRKDVAALLQRLEGHVGKQVTVSVRDNSGDSVVLDWEWQPELQGAVLVLDHGVPRAMVGGSKNTDFNRAVTAKRQLGSTWKPLLFEAALQLRWSTTDALDNRRAAFPYQGWFYYPRPDHKGAPKLVSMSWAATKSENLASIWLLSRLTDRLNTEQFRQLVTRVGLARSADESRAAFVQRVQKAGVVATRSKLHEGLFHQVREEALVDLSFGGSTHQSEALQSLFYGLGVDAEKEKLAEDDDLDEKERAIRSALLEQNFLQQEELAARFEERRDLLVSALASGVEPTSELLAGFALMRGEAGKAQLSFGGSPPELSLPLSPGIWNDLLAGKESIHLDALDPKDDEDAVALQDELEADVEDAAQTELSEMDEADLLFGGAEGPRERDEEREAEERMARSAQYLDPDAVLLDGLLTALIVAELRASIDESMVDLGGVEDLYEQGPLSLCRDFRVLVALRYLRLLAARSGVESEVREVMSMPLGSSELTLIEAARLYEVMQSGSSWSISADPQAMDSTLATSTSTPALLELTAKPSFEGPDDPASMIAELRLPDGRVLYRAQRHAQMVQESDVSMEMASMLRAVVRFGTGRRAEGKVRPSSDDPGRSAELAALDVQVPLFGKTGTTNAYRNSAFLGVVPGLPEGGDLLSWNAGKVVATYVGYDDNREMKRGAIRIAGASGSLPVWITTAQAVVEAESIGERVDLADVAFGRSSVLPLDWPDSFAAINVDSTTGLPVEASVDGSVTLMQRVEPRSFDLFKPLPEDSSESLPQVTP